MNQVKHILTDKTILQEPNLLSIDARLKTYYTLQFIDKIN